MSAGHNHALPSSTNERSLRWALGLTFTFLLAEVVGGVITGSLALISDAAHMFTDVAALAIALAAIRIAKRPANAQLTFGYRRFEILAAAFNALMLFAVAVYIVYEAWQRFGEPQEIQSGPMLAIASLGLIINLVSMRLLRVGKDASLNVKGAYLEVWSDLLGSIGVIAGAVVISLTGWIWVDTVIAVAIGLWVLPRTWVLLRSTINILLEGVPEGMNLSEIDAAIRAVPGVVDVHDLHIWSLTTNWPSLSAHIVHDPLVVEQSNLMAALHLVLAKRDIHHTTLQCEIVPCDQASPFCDMGEGHSSVHRIGSALPAHDKSSP
jgi:cobalt-zinc-cadmium efflux system protein